MRIIHRGPFPSSKRKTRRALRRWLSLSVGVSLFAVTLLGWFAPAQAQQDADSVFDVLEVAGLIDEIVAGFIEDSIAVAEANGSEGVVLQIDSAGHVVSDERLTEVARTIANSAVPVYSWVGPSGATARGGAAQLVLVTEELAVAIGGSLGNTGELIFPELVADSYSVVDNPLEENTVNELSVIELGLAVRDSPTLAFFVLDLPGFMSDIDYSGDEPVRVPTTQVRFSKLPLFDGWVHNLASPSMVYLFFLIGAVLLIFEFFTAGVGIAGGIGAFCFILGCYGLDVLPARNWAVALLVVAMFAFAIDVQVGVPRFWSGVASLALLVGSLFLFHDMAVPWITLLVGILGVAGLMISGMPAMVRTRFGTPTIGREWMVGMLARATEDIKKEGVVDVDGAPWRARVNRSTPIAAGDHVRIVAVEGLYLEIEPEEGGARDYREMHR